MPEINEDAYMMTLEIRDRKFKVDVRHYGKGLTMGQMAQVERTFGVKTAELQDLNAGGVGFIAERVLAWIYGMALVKMPTVTPEDVESLSYEQVLAWFTEIGEKVEAAAAAGQEDQGEDPLAPAPSSTSATIPESSGDPGWDSTTPSDPETSSE